MDFVALYEPMKCPHLANVSFDRVENVNIEKRKRNNRIVNSFSNRPSELFHLKFHKYLTFYSTLV